MDERDRKVKVISLAILMSFFYLNDFLYMPVHNYREWLFDDYAVRTDVLAQFSRTIRPGDRAGHTRRTLSGRDADALHACATLNDEALLSVQLLNTTKQAIAYKLQVAGGFAEITIPANSVQTVRVRLGDSP